MNLAYILLGGNLGDRLLNLGKASDLLEVQAGAIRNKSLVYETEPWGFENTNYFLNQVVVVETLLGYKELFGAIQKIEKVIGRKKGSAKGYESREIDLDILFFNMEIIADKELNIFIPHPRLHLRKFVLVPLNELRPGLWHPVCKETVNSLLNRCEDDKQVRKYLSVDQ